MQPQSNRQVRFVAADQKPLSLQHAVLPHSGTFAAGGAVLLGLLCIVPLWNGFSLLGDANYSFWCGDVVPRAMIGICLGIIVFYIAMAGCAAVQGAHRQNSDTVLFAITNLFITLLGMSLMFMSLPLNRQAVETYDHLMHMCRYSPQTVRMFEYSQVLYNIRSTPECASKYSVEECAGYEDAVPYTNFLKQMESDFRCAGFCYQPPPAVAAAPPAAAGMAPAPAPAGQSPAPAAAAPAAGAPAAAPAASFLEESKEAVNSTVLRSLRAVVSSRVSARNAGRRVERNAATLSATGGPWAPFQAVPTTQEEESTESYPPTLFSLGADYQASCEGMAARDLKAFVGDIGYQTFYQGVYLIFIAITTSLLKLIGICTLHKHEHHAPIAVGGAQRPQQHHPGYY